jgi:hypothetical protein
MNRERIMNKHQAVRAAFLPVCLLGLLLGALLPRTAGAVGEQNARLRGKVIEAGTNVPVGSAKVEIKSEALIGGPRSMLTDDEGRFDFLNIPPGRYQVLVIFEGIKPVRRTLNVSLGQTQEVEIPFSAELTQVETTTIIEERKRLDPDRTSTGMVMTAEQQAKLATGRSYQSIVQQAPGVVGGGNPVMAGGSLRHNRYLVDGLDVTDPVTNTFSANFNFDNISQIEALVVPMDAQYNALGGVINLITKTGSDKFEVDSSFYFNHQALSAGGRAGSQLYQGRLLDQTEPRPPFASYQVNLNVGGPLVKQKLWFYLSAEYRYTLNSVVPGPPLNVQHPSRVFQGIYPRLKLTWAPAQRHRVTWSLSADPAFITNLRQANTYAAEAEYHQNQGGFFSTLNWEWFVRDNLIFQVQAGYTFSNLRISPENGDLINSAQYDQANLITFNAADTFRNQDDQRHRVQFDPTITWTKNTRWGSHTIKAGIQVNYLRHYQMFSTPGNMYVINNTNQAADGGVLVRESASTDLPAACNVLEPNPRMGLGATPCFRTRYYEPIQALIRTGWSMGGFVQDVWKPTAWMTVVPGLRIDYGTFSNSLGEVVQNMLGFGPRLGLSFRLTKDGKTYLKMNYGRANEVSTLLFAASADTGAAFTEWSYNRGNGRFDTFYNKGGGADGYDLRGRCADGTLKKECGNAALSLTPPRTDSVTATLERELFANVIGAFTYTFRYHQFLWEDIELNAVRTLDGGNYAYFADPNKGEVYAYKPTADAYRRYNGFDVSINKYPTASSPWSAFVAYTLSFLEGTVDDQISALRDDPARDFRYRGYLADDHRHQLKAQASYTWKGLTVGGTLTYLSGAPATRLYLQPLGYTGRYGWRGVDPSSDPNDIRKWTEMRSPDIMDIAVRAQYDMHGLIRQHITLIVDLFNALDLSTPVGGSNQAGFENRNAPTFGTVTNRLTPFRAQFALRYQWY